MLRPVFSFLGVAVVCAASVACSSPTDRVGKDGKAVGGQTSPNDPNGTTPPNPNHDEGNPDPQSDQGEQPTPPTCDDPGKPIPDGWKVYTSADIRVAAPATGYTSEPSTPPSIELFSDAPYGTVLGASMRSDFLTKDAMVASWNTVLLGKSGHNCQITTEDTTYQCDDATRMHAVCANGRTIEVLVVMHGLHPYYASCEVNPGGDATICATYLDTLRID